MNLRRHATARDWLDDCGEELERNEALNSLALGAALTGYGGGSPPYLSTVRGRDGALRLAALMIPPSRLVVAGDGAVEMEAIRALLDDLASSGAKVGSLNAPDPLAERIGQAWTRRTGRGARVAMRQRLHLLTSVEPLPDAPGSMRIARADDLPLVADWIAAFEGEAMGSADSARAQAQARERIARGEMMLWEDGPVRCMAARARRTRTTETVNHVYTPPDQRGRGYATALVAALSRLLLADGSRACVLFTDLANPTSNAIYARIGYRPIADFTMLRFAR